MISDRKIPKFDTVNSTFADYYDPVVLSATDSTRNDLVCESRLLTNFAKVEVKSTADAAYQRAFWQRDSANLAQDNLQTNLFRVKHPFGMEMPGRTMASNGYRYGFNGKEKDTEGEWGTQTHYDYGFRIYEPGIGRFLSVDPLSSKYPSWTPYAFAMNRVIDGVDLDGLEYSNATTGESEGPIDPYSTDHTLMEDYDVNENGVQDFILPQVLVSATSLSTKKAQVTIEPNLSLGADHSGESSPPLFGSYWDGVGGAYSGLEKAVGETRFRYSNGRLQFLKTVKDPITGNRYLPGASRINSNSLAKGLKFSGKIATAMSAAVYGADIYNSYQKENRFGVQTQRTTAKAAGGMLGSAMGTAMGVSLGAEFGATVGLLGGPFGEVTVPIGTVAGGVAVGIYGGIYGEDAAVKLFDEMKNSKPVELPRAVYMKPRL